MNRIHINHNAPTHPEANKWLTDFMIDLKKMVLIEENYQPFTLDRLNAWSDKHRQDVESCADFAANMRKRLSNELIPEHQDAISCFNRLVIDLKLMVANKPYTEITESRIEEADKYWSKIVYCRKRRTIYY